MRGDVPLTYEVGDTSPIFDFHNCAQQLSKRVIEHHTLMSSAIDKNLHALTQFMFGHSREYESDVPGTMKEEMAYSVVMSCPRIFKGVYYPLGTGLQLYAINLSVCFMALTTMQC